MYRGLLLVLAFALAMPITAKAETVADIMREFGMLGTFADDCSQPPNKNNFHTVYAELPNGFVERIYYNEPGKIYSRYVLQRVNRVSADQVFYQQKGSAGNIDVILQVAGDRYHVLSSQNENGTAYVQNGRYTSATSAPGRESTWQTKCHD